MGTTQFPKIPAAPNNPDLNSLAGYVKDMANLFGVLSKELDFLLNGSLDIQNIRAKSITSESIKAGAITTDELAAGAVTADKISVTELSAITANMGHLTSGRIDSAEIYGSYIATADGTFPRSEMDVSGNLFRIYLDADNYIEINPVFGGGSPAISATVEGNTAYQLTAATAGVVLSTGAKDLTLSTTVQGDIHLSPEAGYNVYVPGWDVFVDNSSGEALASALLDLTTSINNLSTIVSGKATSGNSTGSAGPFNGGIPIGTQLAVNGGGFVTWAGIGAHSHTQT